MLIDLQRPRAKKISDDVLLSLAKNRKEMEEERRRCQLESKLYKRWRMETNPDTIILNSKNDHQAIAKLNWLDRQVEDHMEREQSKKESEERQLQLQQEVRKREECLTKCREIRDAEIKELRSIQEHHMCELKLREEQSSELYTRELKLKEKLKEIEYELNQISTNTKIRNYQLKAQNNYRRIKMQLRERSENILSYIEEDIKILERINSGFIFKNNNEKINYLKQKFDQYYENELIKSKQIEGMYESEAKEVLHVEQETWTRESEIREKQLRNLFAEQICIVNEKITATIAEQENLIKIKETHLRAIETTNEKLKELKIEESSDTAKCKQIETLLKEVKLIDNTTDDTDNKENKNKKMINNIITGDYENVNQKDKINYTIDNNGPRFGRKKVAWC